MLCRHFVLRGVSALGPRARARPKGSRQHLRGARADPNLPKRAALTFDRTQDQAVLKEQRNPVFIRTYNHADQCFFKPQLFHHQLAKTNRRHSRHTPISSRLQLKEYLEDPANIPYCCPGSSTKALLLPSTPAQTTIFPESLRRISKEPCEIHRCSCTGHPKYEQNRTFRTADQDLSRIPTRTDHNFSRPQFFQAPDSS